MYTYYIYCATLNETVIFVLELYLAKKTDFSDYFGAVISIGFMLFVVFIIGCSIFNSIAGNSQANGTCRDVTTHDYNWDNDMLCTREDGTQFHTNYAGADQFEKSGKETREDKWAETTLEVRDAPSSAATEKRESSAGSCQDVTSYDQNWSNDMLCTRPDGTTFYTDYSGARAYEN